jgi:hypothetical protein
MSLEDEIKKELSDAIRRDRMFIEAAVSGREVDADWPDLVAFLNRRIEAGEAAIFRLAREIDRLRP